MTLLRIWIGVTVVVLATLAVWAFAPILIFMALLVVVLGGLAAIMIGQARRLRACLWGCKRRRRRLRQPRTADR
ncbi:MAG: hypothetical protein J2P50_13420 [Hyphomicrobiaceae bacterium]|nr:hypothetical protein [Hyphomicrobiaceae bacterium]